MKTNEESFLSLSRDLEAYKRAAPPPTTIPSEIAALVAHKASVTLSLISPTSTSDPPPILITML
jgi:hypothetical protein